MQAAVRPERPLMKRGLARVTMLVVGMGVAGVAIGWAGPSLTVRKN